MKFHQHPRFRLFCTLLWLYIPFFALGQNSTHLLKGRVTDLETGESLSYVHIFLSGQQYGTATNKEGKFQIRVSASHVGDTLVFSYMGYERQEVPINDRLLAKDDLDIALIPTAYTLSTAEVMVIDATKIVEDAIGKISTNYPMRAFGLKGFFREAGYRKDNGAPLLFAEGVIWLYKNRLNSKLPVSMSDFASIEKGYRKKIPYQLVVDGQTYHLPQITEGAYAGVSLDIVRSWYSFLRKEMLKRYLFDYAGTDILDGKRVIVIRFYPKSTNNFGWMEGNLFIEKESNAIVKAKYSYTKNALYTFNVNSTKENLYLTNREFEIDYFKYQDKWYLQNSRVHSDFTELRTNIPIRYNMDYVTNQVEPKARKIPRMKNIADKNSSFAFEEKIEEVADDYWGNETILEREDHFAIAKESDAPTIAVGNETSASIQEPPQKKTSHAQLTVLSEEIDLTELQLVKLPTLLDEVAVAIPSETQNNLHALFSFDVEVPAMGAFQYGDTEIPLLLSPGTEAIIVLGKQEGQELSVEYYGNGISNNKFLQNYRHLRQSLLRNVQRASESADAAGYQKQVAVYKAACLQFLERYEHRGEGLDSVLLQWIKNDIRYGSAQLLLSYPIMTGTGNFQNNLPADFFAPLENLPINNAQAIHQASYQEFLKYYHHYQQKLAEQSGNTDIYDLDFQIELSEKYFSGNPLYFLQSFLLIKASLLNLKNSDRAIRRFMKGAAPESLKAQVQEAQINNKYPDFWSIVSPSWLKQWSGEQFDPAPLKDKIVYIDFWATWCGPCVYEMTFAKQMIKSHRKDDEVVFLFISLDRNESHWRAYLKPKVTNQKNTIHLMVEREHHEGLTSRLGVYTIPRFMLLNRNGRLVDTDAPRPSSGTVPLAFERVREMQIRQ